MMTLKANRETSKII